MHMLVPGMGLVFPPYGKLGNALGSAFQNTSIGYPNSSQKSPSTCWKDK